MSWSNRYKTAGRYNLGTGHYTESLSEMKQRIDKELRAMASVNLVMLLGNLGADPEVKYTQNGKAFCKLSLATTEKWTDGKGVKQEKTEWHRLILWGHRAEACGRICKKGSTIHIQGKLQTTKYQDQNGKDQWSTDIVVDNIEFVKNLKEQDPAGSYRYENEPHA